MLPIKFLNWLGSQNRIVRFAVSFVLISLILSMSGGAIVLILAGVQYAPMATIITILVLTISVIAYILSEAP